MVAPEEMTKARNNILDRNQSYSDQYIAGHMATLMVNRGFNPGTAFRYAVKKTNSKRKSFDAFFKKNSGLVYSELQSKYGDGNGFEENGKRLFNLAKAYTSVDGEDAKQMAKQIGLVMVDKKYFGPATSVFKKYGKFKPEEVAKEIGNFEVRNEYLSHLVKKMKGRRQKNLDKREGKANEEYRNVAREPVVSKVEKLGTNLRKFKAEYEKWGNKYEDKGKELSELGERVYNLTNEKQYLKDSRKYKELEKEMEEYVMKVAEFDKKIATTSMARKKAIEEYKKNKKSYFEEKAKRTERSEERLQKDANNMGYNVDLFPEWKEKLEKGELGASEKYLKARTGFIQAFTPDYDPAEDKVLSSKGKKYLKNEAEKYLRKGEVYNAIGALEAAGKKATANRLRKYLRKAGGDESEASKKYFKGKDRMKKAVVIGAVALPVIGGGIGSAVKYKNITHKPITIEKRYEWKDLEERGMIHTVKSGDKLLKIVKKYHPRLNEQGLKRRNNRIAAEHGLYEDTVSVTPDGKVVNQPDGIIGDVIKPGMKIEVGKELVPVIKKETKKYKSVERVEEKGKWPNKKGAAYGAGIGALLGGLLGFTRKRRETAA